MTFRDWAPWDLDVWTLGWDFWIAFFIIWETASGIWGEQEQLTNHLRPVFLSAPVIWFLAFGIWLWLGVHLLVPTLEAWISKSAGGI